MRAIRGPWRLFAVYLALTAVPIAVLGLMLASGFRDEARARGLAEARAQAALLAGTAIETDLGDRTLNRPLTAEEQDQLRALTRRVIASRQVLRLRLRDPQGHVVFSDDGSGRGLAVEDEVLDAARGTTIAKLTRLNADVNDRGHPGVSAAEIYLPLRTSGGAILGVLEVYLPYAPIAQDLSTGLHTLYRDLAIGLTILYLVLFVISLSVTGRLRREGQRTARLARFDTLTGLPNRALFQRRVAHALAAAASTPATITVATADLDRFREINDALGHDNGDRVLIELAGRLAAEIGPEETVARLGGDELGFILHGSGDPEPRLRQLRALIEADVGISGLALSVESSFGYVVLDDHDDAPDVITLMRRTDAAMFAAKSAHTGVLRYHADLERFDAARLALVTELRHAIDDDQLVLHYQPQQNLADPGTVAFEALVRWQHPTRGLLFPGTFLDLAEQTDLIDPLTRWVLRRALADLDVLDPSQARSVAVNVSARNLSSPDLVDDVLRALHDAGAHPGRLVLEVTETAVLADPPRAVAVLARLSEAGVRISLDDFGQGQTSLAHLSTLPLAELKIDRSFVTDLITHPAHAAIVRSVIELGHNLGLTVVGEGVEDDATLRALAELGCDLGQGYGIARPAPVAQVAAALDRAGQTGWGVPSGSSTNTGISRSVLR